MSFLPGLLLGGAIGAGLAWLYSPRSGRDNRQVLAERVDEVLPGSSDLIRERAREVVEEQRERLQRAAEEARRSADRAREQLTQRYRSASEGTSGEEPLP